MSSFFKVNVQILETLQQKFYRKAKLTVKRGYARLSIGSYENYQINLYVDSEKFLIETVFECIDGRFGMYSTDFVFADAFKSDGFDVNKYTEDVYEFFIALFDYAKRIHFAFEDYAPYDTASLLIDKIFEYANEKEPAWLEFIAFEASEKDNDLSSFIDFLSELEDDEKTNYMAGKLGLYWINAFITFAFSYKNVEQDMAFLRYLTDKLPD